MDYIALAIPVFFLLIGVELVAARVLERPSYRLSDSFGDLSCGVLQQVAEVFLKTALFAGYAGLYSRYRLFEIPTNAASAWVACFLGQDFLYYWFHRAMHGRWLYKRIHGWHHRIVTPWAITGHYMHPLEYNLTGAVALIGPLLLGSHLVVVWLWFCFRQWEAAEGHCGYDFPWTPTHFLPGNDGAVHHDVHHARVRGNYAGFLTIWDGVFGTYARGYAEELAARR